MATKITIVQGDADTITETITGLASLAGYTAKFYIYTVAGVSVATITGSIDTLTITYEFVNEGTKAYTVGEHWYETKIFDGSDHVYTPASGVFAVLTAKTTNDPS